jgi:hypothetical protein
MRVRPPLNHKYDSLFSKASVWMQSATGLSIKDLALFGGGLLTVIAVLLIGLYTGKPRYREAARFSWLLLLLSFAVLAWALTGRTSIRAR